jgi:hypothetical protein
VGKNLNFLSGKGLKKIGKPIEKFKIENLVTLL